MTPLLRPLKSCHRRLVSTTQRLGQLQDDLQEMRHSSAAGDVELALMYLSKARRTLKESITERIGAQLRRTR